MALDLTALELNDEQFEQISEMVYRQCGINLKAGKEGLVKARLAKRLRVLGLSGFDEYMRLIKEGGPEGELTSMIDVLTTNKTNFFREPQHFEFLRKTALPPMLAENRRIRIWSAGCSSGEEPYTIGITLREEIPDIGRRDVRILATDISTRVLATAKEGVYDRDRLEGVPDQILHKYFTSVSNSRTKSYRIHDSVRSLITFGHLNLMGDWPMKGPFDIIFCRNVMIYFDRATQQKLVRRYWQLLAPGGYLFVGHSESLTAWSHEFKYVQPAVYVK